MAIQSKLDEVKIVLELGKGQQTIPKCNKGATDEALYEVGEAIGQLQSESVLSIRKIEESILS